MAIYTDAPDPRTYTAWEKRVRKRLEDASDIFEHHCRVRFEVVKVDHWDSDPSVHSFDQSLMEFVQKVRPAPARVAIGFTTHYEWIAGEMHLGGTHGALASHVLIRESPGQVSEPERLEVLVHELGHFLGAAHTSDKASVMRPKLGDRQSAAKTFRIGFDAPNTLIMCLIAEEMRTRHIWHPSVLSPDAKTAVRGAYMALAQTIPQDPVSTSSIESLGPAPPPGRPARQPEPGDHQRRAARGAGRGPGGPREPEIARRLQGPEGCGLADQRRAHGLITFAGPRPPPGSFRRRSGRRRSCSGWAWRWMIPTSCATRRRSARSGRRSSRTISGRRGC